MPHTPTTRRRVLHVAQPVEAGVAVVVRDLVTHQAAAGHDVAVACPPDGSLPGWVRDAGATPLAWPATRSPGPSSIAEARRLARLVRDHRPDLVHLHSSKAGLAGRLAVRGRVPTVFQPHAWSFLAGGGPLRAASLGWERFGARWADAIACVSDDEQRIGETAGVAGRWFRCTNGVDLDRFAPAGDERRTQARAALGLPGGPVVLCVGRLSRQKGQDVLVDAWRRMGGVGGAVLVLVGDGPDRAALETAAATVADRSVILAGETSDVPAWYAAADVFVQPSRWEGASLSVREAMASGLCVVATDVAGNRELPGIGEHAVPVDDAAALGAALAERIADRQRRVDEGRANRATAEREFGLDAAVRTVDAMYATVLANRSG